MNIELLQKVRDWLLDKNDSKHKFIMHFFAVPTDCGTACCIGGKGLLLSGYKSRGSNMWLNPDGKVIRDHEHDTSRFTAEFREAARVFDLTTQQAQKLFLITQWPEQFTDRVFSTNRELAAARIDHFITTQGRE